MTADPKTIAVYDARAAEYATLDPSDTPDANLRAFLAALPAAARVLDLGAGPGRSARFIAAAGHDVLAVDASQAMVDLASEQPGVAAQQASFDDLPDLGMFDGIWANFSLLHARAEDLPRHLSEIHAALTPKGVFHIALKLGTQDQATTERDRIGRRYVYLRDSDLMRRLDDAGFTPISERRGRDIGLSGDLSDWIAVLSHA
ncbi:MAG: class I SAM-dependent methyltransferase [Paracoccaceae bacterium]